MQLWAEHNVIAGETVPEWQLPIERQRKMLVVQRVRGPFQPPPPHSLHLAGNPIAGLVERQHRGTVHRGSVQLQCPATPGS